MTLEELHKELEHGELGKAARRFAEALLKYVDETLDEEPE